MLIDPILTHVSSRLMSVQTFFYFPPSFCAFHFPLIFSLQMFVSFIYKQVSNSLFVSIFVYFLSFLFFKVQSQSLHLQKCIYEYFQRKERFLRQPK